MSQYVALISTGCAQSASRHPPASYGAQRRALPASPFETCHFEPVCQPIRDVSAQSASRHPPTHPPSPFPPTFPSISPSSWCHDLSVRLLTKRSPHDGYSPFKARMSLVISTAKLSSHCSRRDLYSQLARGSQGTQYELALIPICDVICFELHQFQLSSST